jgi:hypothetical protein
VSGQSGAAAKLGIPRSTLESKIRSLKINKNRFKTTISQQIAFRYLLSEHSAHLTKFADLRNSQFRFSIKLPIFNSLTLAL